jgi:hypothetical protein
VIRGWQRAGSWVTLFGSGSGGNDYPTPSFIYAATPSDRANHGPSRRPAETLSPLAAKLGLQVNSKFGQGAEAKLMREVLGLSGTVLICWEHHAIIGGILPARSGVACRRNGMPIASMSSCGSMVSRHQAHLPSANSIRACSTVTCR